MITSPPKRGVISPSTNCGSYFAYTLEDLRAAQRLRWQVFVEEMGARLTASEPGLVNDRSCC